ncbi:MAG TPA: S8 family serine peptidase [Rudaea sp.]|nr:S8 family serine peptidase [Rudaea sp.]
MRALFILLLVFLALAGCASSGGVRDTGGTKLLVTIRYDAIDNLLGNAGDHYHRPSSYGAGPGAGPLLDALAAEYAITRVSGWPMRTLGVHCEVFATARGSDAEAVAARLAHDPRVDSAEPMRQFRTLTNNVDPYRPLQHALDTLEVDAAHAMSSGAGVRVAVIDSGIDASHPDLAGVVRSRRDFTSGPLAPHGTEVAGLIAARGANGTGILGVAPMAQLDDLRACRAGAAADAPAVCDSYTLAQALDFAVNSQVDVINLSLAGPDDPLLARLLAGAEARGISVVVAAPPAADTADRFPASVPTVVAVATSEGAAQWPASAIRAPGIDVLTTFPGNRYDYGSGSSLSSAHVSGVVALMRSLDRSLNPGQVRALLAAHRQLSAATVLKEEAAQLAQR